MTKRVLGEAALVTGVGAFQVFSAYVGGERHSAVPLDALGLALLLVGPLALPLRFRAPLFVVAISTLAGVVYFPRGHPGAAIFLTVVVAIVSLRRRQAAEERAAAVAEQARLVTEERLALARDLHDVLAHSLSVVQVQAGVALHLMDERPDQVRAALTAIRSASGDGVRELRSAVDALRRDDHARAGPLAPVPDLDDLPDLVSGAERAGLEVQVLQGERSRPVPRAVSLAAYRVVQEALTNVVRHAGATRCDIRIHADGRRLRVVVEDDGRSRHAAVEGNGLRGMRERVDALGGSVRAGPRPGGGFAVRAELPW